jgi:hypothetical protein
MRDGVMLKLMQKSLALSHTQYYTVQLFKMNT